MLSIPSFGNHKLSKKTCRWHVFREEEHAAGPHLWGVCVFQNGTLYDPRFRREGRNRYVARTGSARQSRPAAIPPGGPVESLDAQVAFGAFLFLII